MGGEGQRRRLGYLEGSSSDDLAAARVWRMGAALGVWEGEKMHGSGRLLGANSALVSMAAEGPSMTGAACTRRRRAGRHDRPLHSRLNRMRCEMTVLPLAGMQNHRSSHRVLLFVSTPTYVHVACVTDERAL
jgi:hypothetical protein